MNCLCEKDYSEIVKHCSSEINLSNSPHLGEALLLRATFYLLRGEGNKAMEDLDRLMNMADVSKDVSVHNIRIFHNLLILCRYHYFIIPFIAVTF